MTEKADLLDQLQHYEHINIQLENETETIGMVNNDHVVSHVIVVIQESILYCIRSRGNL